MLKTASKLVSASQLITPIALAGDVTLSTGNLIIGTSGKGIDFSATPGTGTSELLSDYEEGTWTPTVSSLVGTITTVGAVSGRYIKVGSQVTVFATVNITTRGTADGGLVVAGLPFAPNTSLQASYTPTGANFASALTVGGFTISSHMTLRYYDGTFPADTGNGVYVTSTYLV